jgi:hypothetical protein
LYQFFRSYVENIPRISFWFLFLPVHHGSITAAHGRGILAAVPLPVSIMAPPPDRSNSLIFSRCRGTTWAAPHCTVEHRAFRLSVSQKMIQITGKLIQKAVTENFVANH